EFRRVLFRSKPLDMGLELGLKILIGPKTPRFFCSLELTAVDEFPHAVAAYVIKQFAASGGYVLQRDPGGQKLHWKGVIDISGVLMSILRGPAQKTQRLTGESTALKNEVHEIEHLWRKNQI